MTRIELRHYSSVPFELDRERAYEQRVHMKPRGLWVSVLGEYDWPSWCRGEQFALDRLEVEQTVQLSDRANILQLAGAEALDAFTKNHVAPSYPGERLSMSIDWTRVAAEFDGILITPYVWERRLELMWYYAWDCASGCIWNLDAIESMTDASVLS